jgi:hypothetical protein
MSASTIHQIIFSWIIPLLLVIRYYLYHGILTPITFLFNRSYLLRHPERNLPTLIAPARNYSIHSFTPPLDLTKQHALPDPPPKRHWCHPKDLDKRTPDKPKLESSIVPNGELVGPALRQGMIILQQDCQVYIQEEIGRWPTRDDYLLTLCINLESQHTFRLFIPVSFMDRSAVYDESPRCPLRTPFSLIEAIHYRRSLHPSSASISSV